LTRCSSSLSRVFSSSMSHRRLCSSCSRRWVSSSWVCVQSMSTSRD
jgi:hypothetical protein